MTKETFYLSFIETIMKETLNKEQLSEIKRELSTGRVELLDSYYQSVGVKKEDLYSDNALEINLKLEICNKLLSFTY